MFRKIFLSLAMVVIMLVSDIAVHANTPATPCIDQQKILANAPDLNPKALRYAINGYQWALKHSVVNNPTVLTVIDFDLPSSAKRVWVINLKTSEILLNTYTTHGKGSGYTYATHFSNQPNSEKTSLGIYKTLSVYHGKHGTSMRLQGLERGLNDNVYSRAIVVHPAWYATQDFVDKYHRTGCSWGCFAFAPETTNKFVDLTKQGSIIFAYSKQEDDDPIVRV